MTKRLALVTSLELAVRAAVVVRGKANNHEHTHFHFPHVPAATLFMPCMLLLGLRSNTAKLLLAMTLVTAASLRRLGTTRVLYAVTLFGFFWPRSHDSHVQFFAAVNLRV